MKTLSLIVLLAVPLAGSTAYAQQPPPGTQQQLTPEQQKAAAMRLPELDRSALTPDERRRKKLEVDQTERNPFGMVTRIADQMLPAQPPTEDKKIQQVLRNMRVSGIADSSSGPRVLLGSLSLGVGDYLPRLFANQVEKLVVKAINDRGVVLTFVEPENSRRERSIGLPIDLEPRVNSLLVGETLMKVVPFDGEGNPSLPPLQNDSALKSLEAAEAQGFQSILERQTELLNAPAVPASSDEGQKP